MIQRTLGRAFVNASIVAAMAVSAPAAAQRFNRIVAFGDSYADDGNAFELARIDPRTTGVYTTGRFSGGTNYVDTLSQLLRVPVDNFAIGGARTNAGNETFGLPGFTAEVAAFRSGGGGVFPRVSGTLDPKDLVTISIGGNDSRAFQRAGGTVAGAPADAARAVGFAASGIQSLVSAGARTISFLAGDTSRLPEVNFLPNPAGAIAVRSAYSNAFNSGIQQVLANQAANGVIVHYLDLNAILNRVTANFGAFGLTGLACPAFPPPLGPGRPGSFACADQNTASRFLIYGDQLHLTSAGFAIIGRYVEAQVTAPLMLQASSDMGLETARHFGSTLTRLVDLAPARDGETAHGARFFLFGDHFRRDFARSETNERFDVTGVGGTAGVEYGLGNGLVGIAASYAQPRARFLDGASRVRGRSLHVGVYGGYVAQAAFVQAHLGYGTDDYRITRKGVIDNLTARPDGDHITAGAKAGYLVPIGRLRAGPVVAVHYAKGEVDAYTEQGDAALALNVGAMQADSLTGSVGLELRGAFTSGETAFRPFAIATVEKELDDNGRAATFAQTSAPTIVNRFDFSKPSREIYGRLAAGASASLASTVRLEATVSATVGQDDGDQFSALLGVRVGF